MQSQKRWLPTSTHSAIGKMYISGSTQKECSEFVHGVVRQASRRFLCKKTILVVSRHRCEEIGSLGKVRECSRNGRRRGCCAIIQWMVHTYEAAAAWVWGRGEHQLPGGTNWYATTLFFPPPPPPAVSAGGDEGDAEDPPPPPPHKALFSWTAAVGISLWAEKWRQPQLRMNALPPMSFFMGLEVVRSAARCIEIHLTLLRLLPFRIVFPLSPFSGAAVITG